MAIDIYNPKLYLDRDKKAFIFIHDMLLDGECCAALCMYGNGKDYLFQNLVREFSQLQLPYTIKVLNTLSEGELKAFADELKKDDTHTLCFINLRIGKDVSWFIKTLEDLRIKRGTSFITHISCYAGDVYEALCSMNKILTEGLVIQELVTFEDAVHILDNEFAPRFGFSLTKSQKKEIYTWSYGHVGLLKSLYLLKKNYPKTSFTKKYLLQNISIMQRLMEIIANTPESMIQVMLGKKHNPLLTLYAEKIGYIKNGKIFNPLIEELIPQISRPDTAVFSTTELRVLDYLKKHKNQLITREDVARSIWGEEDWEEKYSEWAIGQLVYRIRKKLQRSSEHYDIQTKKGAGFILLQK